MTHVFIIFLVLIVLIAFLLIIHIAEFGILQKLEQEITDEM
jgi:hypothetical protein